MHRISKLILIFIGIFSHVTSFSQDADSTKAKKKLSFLALPLIINTPETGFGGGAIGSVVFKANRDTSIRSSNAQVYGIYTERSQVVIGTGGNVYFPKENYIIRWFGTYSDFPDRFYGIGNNTPKSNKELYTYTQFYLNSQITRRVYKKLYTGLFFEIQDVTKMEYTPGGLFDQENVLGRHGGNSRGIGPMVVWDNRNHAFYPTGGMYLQVSSAFYRKALGSDFKFGNYILDVRKFFKSYKQNVLAFQFYSQITAGEVPFRSLPYLGGPFFLRGYYLGRYRDKSNIILQSEYRMHLYKRFGAVVFAGVGEVGPQVTDFTFDGLKYSVGTGLRFAIMRKENVNIRLDVALGKQSSGFYLYILEAF